MATVAPPLHPAPITSRPSTVVNDTVSTRSSNIVSTSNPLPKPPPLHEPYEASASNTSPGAVPAVSTAPISSKKNLKAKKTTDPMDTSKLLAAKIAQLELDKAGERDQEAEIDREVKKATRDLSNLLSNIDSPMTKLDVVQKKYSELLADMRRLDRANTKNKKRADQLQKEKDQGRTELSKSVSMKEKLEKLCRELQRENKKMKEEHRSLVETEKRGREELNETFDGVLWEIQTVISQKEDPSSQKLNMETDELFRQKFKSFLDQYELREIHFQSALRTAALESQYNNARFEQQRKRAEQETSRSRALSTQVSTFSQTETDLRTQLNIYVEKFKQVEDTLNNSNDLFLTFRKEMEEMSKKTKRLEKENLTLTRKHDLTNRNILEMAEERTKTNKELVTLRKKNANLENLCRGMQAQGRGTAVGPAATAVAGHTPQTRTDGEVDALEEEDEEEGTESDYTYDDDASEGRDDHDDDDGSESIGDDDEGEYEDDEDEDEDEDEDGDGDDETEEELLRSTTGIVAPPPPPPPPPPPALAAAAAAATAAAALPTPSTPMVNGQKRSRSQPSQHQASKDQQDHSNGPTATNGASHQECVGAEGT